MFKKLFRRLHWFLFKRPTKAEYMEIMDESIFSYVEHEPDYTDVALCYCDEVGYCIDCPVILNGDLPCLKWHFIEDLEG